MIECKLCNKSYKRFVAHLTKKHKITTYKYLKNSGYEVLIVWAYDFSTRKEDIIKECKDFLYKGEMKNV